jgi:hypothetical protein
MNEKLKQRLDALIMQSKESAIRFNEKKSDWHEIATRNDSQFQAIKRACMVQYNANDRSYSPSVASLVNILKEECWIIDRGVLVYILNALGVNAKALPVDRIESLTRAQLISIMEKDH